MVESHANEASMEVEQRRPRCFMNGGYDFAHLGHFNALRQVWEAARSKNGVVIAGIHSNAEIRRIKGGAFMNSEEEKERLLLSSIFCSYSPCCARSI